MERTKVARLAATWSAVGLAALIGPGMAGADQASPERAGHGRHGGPGLSLFGRALSQQGQKEMWGIDIRARAPEKGEAQGWVRFGHGTNEKAEGFIGQVRCLSKDAAGIVQLSGTV